MLHVTTFQICISELAAQFQVSSTYFCNTVDIIELPIK